MKWRGLPVTGFELEGVSCEVEGVSCGEVEGVCFVNWRRQVVKWRG